MANLNATYNNVRIDGMLTVNKLRIKDDKSLNFTPKNQMSVSTDNSYTYTKEKNLLFNQTEDNGYGYGMLIDKDEVQFGYGTKEQFFNHSIKNGVTVDKDGVNIENMQSVQSIPEETIQTMLQDILQIS